MAQTASTTTAFQYLNGQQYISLTTFRKNGQPVPTPVWFAEHDGKLYVYSGAKAGKIKRLGHTARVTLAPCTFRGQVVGAAVDGTARLLTTPDERKLAEDGLNRKYGLVKRALNLLDRLMGGKETDRAYIEISPG
jgi:uncharacterized protein